MNWYTQQSPRYTEYNPQCIGFAAFPCISKGFQDKGLDFIHIFVNEDDNVPRFNSDQGYLLSEHVSFLFLSYLPDSFVLREPIGKDDYDQRVHR